VCVCVCLIRLTLTISIKAQYYSPNLTRVKIKVTFCPKHRILKLCDDFTAARVKTTLMKCYSGS